MTDGGDMSKREIYDAVKKATVGIVIETPERLPKRPYTIIGSGFCIHKEGIVVTCEHVHRAFFDPDVYRQVMTEIATQDGVVVPVPSKGTHRPQVIFFGGAQGTNVVMPMVGVTDATCKTNFDLAIYRLDKRHAAFSGGYPTISIADYADLHEMMEVGLCGFPLGDSLFDQIGTVSSSFTTGRISSIIPVAGVTVEHLRGFQLDLTATNGNSGGPVFSLDTGKVFGVLQRGVSHPSTQHVVQGLAKAEPVYPALEHDLIDRLLKGTHRPPGY